MLTKSTNYYNIPLTLDEMNQCGVAAYQKSIASKNFNKKGMEEDFLLDVKAFGAELAISKMLNIAPQTGIGKFLNGALPDIVHNHPNKKTYEIDVKTVKQNHYKYMIVETVRPTWLYFMVKGSLDTATFQPIGYCKGSQIPTGLIDFNNGREPCRAILISNLTPFTGSYGN